MKDDQIAGGIFGVAIGDALGVPGERFSMFSSIKKYPLSRPVLLLRTSPL